MSQLVFQSFKIAERLLLDPLKELNADMNGAAFGFGLPPSLGLGISCVPMEESTSSHFYGGGTIDRVVTGRPEDFLSRYDISHEQYTKKLIVQAGGLDR